MVERKIKKTLRGQKTSDGAGVKLTRLLGYNTTELFDPFLLMDHFGSDNPNDYISGFPFHPHRGIETVTYMLSGKMEHQDHLGNKGEIGAGDIQWMTAGKGILHQEMPKLEGGKLSGFQLWLNLPATHKMMSPRYQDISVNKIPIIQTDSVLVKLIAGELDGKKGPVEDTIIKPVYLDVLISPNASWEYLHKEDVTMFLYLFHGEMYIGESKKEKIVEGEIVLLSSGEILKISTSDNGARFVLIAGKPVKESIAWRGPIVMNTEEELLNAYIELEEGRFIQT
ncbi:MAG: pirin family protein [Leptospiraceae bacterium]|nr:pirin family protein [Leptospiraceae bacterium]MCK6381819.1 pirin family protein [Leptospiraceae bacterium]NUM40959.1 pirin family protein [Leptospiraceae bacterium]